MYVCVSVCCVYCVYCVCYVCLSIRRLQSVARVGMHAVRAWDDHDLLHQVMEVERDAHWWHVLTTMDVPFDYRG